MLKLNHVSIKFKKEVIDDSSICVNDGTLTGLIGDSGSGKSSLLDVLSLFRYEGQCDYEFNDTDLKKASKEELQEIQRTKISYLRQTSQFLSTMNCLDNILIECEISGQKMDEKRGKEILKMVDLDKKSKVYPSKLSGGEKQRLAIAMAIAKDSEIIICDEITSALDSTNTKKIIELLKDLAHKKGKMVILSSHEEDVIQQCDTIYEIEDKKIKLRKESCFDLDKKEKPTVHKKNKKFYLKTVASRLKKKKVVFICLMLLSAIAVSTLNYTIHWVDQSKRFYNALLDKTMIGEISVSNTNGVSADGIYFSLYLPFEDTEVQDIANTKGVDKIYPFYGGRLLDSYTGKNEITWSKDGETLGTFTVKQDNYYLRGHLDEVYPYYPEQRLDEICDIKTNENQGVYINDRAAKEMGIETLEDGTSISFEFYPVVAIKDSVLENFTYNEKTKKYVSAGTSPCIERVYDKKVKVELPISGILPESYREVGSVSNVCPLYIPYDVFEKCQRKASASYELKEGESAVEHSCYRVFLEKGADRKETKRELLDISDSLTLNDNFENVNAIQEASRDADNYLSISMAILFIITLILLYVYSIFHCRDTQDDYFFFHIRGVSEKQLREITLLEFVVIWLMVFVLGLIFVNLILVRGIGQYKVMTNDIASIKYTSIVLWNFVLAGVAAVVSELSLLLKRK